jgi:hypothetical protein
LWMRNALLPAPTESSEPLHSNHTDEDVPEQQMVNSMCQTDPLQVCIKIYWSVLQICCMSLYTFCLIFLCYLVYLAR